MLTQISQIEEFTKNDDFGKRNPIYTCFPFWKDASWNRTCDDLLEKRNLCQNYLASNFQISNKAIKTVAEVMRQR